jgi:quercetin dioxygenase-like cupin family protein
MRGDPGDDERPLSFLDRPPGPRFARTVVELEPGGTRPYDAAEWHGALVVVERGEVELQRATGGGLRLRRGAVLCLAGLGLRALHNPGAEPTVLVAVRRADRRAGPITRQEASRGAGCAPAPRRAADPPTAPPPADTSPSTG